MSIDIHGGISSLAAGAGVPAPTPAGVPAPTRTGVSAPVTAMLATDGVQGAACNDPASPSVRGSTG